MRRGIIYVLEKAVFEQGIYFLLFKILIGPYTQEGFEIERQLNP